MFKRIAIAALSYILSAVLAVAQVVGPGGNVIPPNNTPPQITPQYVVQTNAALLALNPTYVTVGGVVLRQGFYAAGDGGAMYYTYTSTPCTLSAGAGDNGSQVQASGGGCWLADFTYTRISPNAWGAHGTGALADDAVPLQAMFAYVATLPLVDIVGGNYQVTGRGGTYGTSLPLNIPKNIHLYDISFVALNGGSWCASDGSITVPNPTGGTTTIGPSTCGVLNIPSSSYSVTFDDVHIDVNRITNATGIYCAAPGNIQLNNTLIIHWIAGGNGMVEVPGCSVIHFNDDFQEWAFGDPEYPGGSTRRGVALGLFGAYDNTFHGGNYALALVPIYVGVGATKNIFLAAHPYQGPVSNAPYVNPNGIIYDGYGNLFDGTYLDSAPLLIRVTNATNGQKPQIIFKNTQALYNAANSTFSSFVQFTTSVASTALNNAYVDGNFPATATTQTYQFSVTGAGTWIDAANVAATTLNSVIGDAALKGPVSSTTWFLPNTNGLGLAVQSQFLNLPRSVAGTAYTLAQTDTDEFLYFNAGTTVAITVPRTITVGTHICFISVNAGATIQAVASGTINGVGTAITLLQNKPYCYQAFFNDGTNTIGAVMGSGL